jgi:hypothetical protein
MSEENVELVRRIHERWGREESIRELVADDLEYVNPTYAVEPGTRIGRDSFGSVRETYPNFVFHPSATLTRVTTSSCSAATPLREERAASSSRATTATCGQ